MSVSLVQPAPFDPRRLARFRYWAGWDLEQIAEELSLPPATVRSWKARDGWDKAKSIVRQEESLEFRYIQLIHKDPKTGGDFKEIDLIGRQLERIDRRQRFQDGGTEADLNPKLANRNAGEKKAPKRNHFTEEQIAQLGAAFEAAIYGHQRTWLNCSSLRTRVILKARQIGATLYFAWEALLKALETGHNQVFLSASKAQALHFRQYIVDFAWKHVGVKLQGDPIVIDRGEGEEAVTLYFLGTNYRTAQGYHGDFYFDEFFWVHGFEQIEAVASGIATQKKYRKTYFSTPSSVAHPAYPFWTGENRNKGRAKAERVKIDVGHDALKAGRLCEDRKWRQIVTIHDAEEAGYDLFDVDELREEYSPDRFNNLFLCQFIDDAESMFPMADLLKCTVEAFDAWKDFDFYRQLAGVRCFDGAVWVGYDPSDTGDSAGLVVLAPPTATRNKFRVLERVQLRGLDFAQQAAAIERITKRYNVAYLGIDATGLGAAVLQLVKVFYPAVRALNYSVELKTEMVLKAQHVIRTGRLEFDAGMVDLMQALVSIRKTLTKSGRQVTYEAPRTEEGGHADLAWALMHALINEPLEAANGGDRRSFLEIYS